MSKDDEQVEEPEIVEEQGAEPAVEFDKEIENLGDVVDNPVLEEEPDETDEQPEGEAEETEDSPAEAEEVPPAEDEAEVPQVEEVAEVDEPITDPGEFVPKGEYAFEITTIDGRTIKISTPAEADAFAERLDNEENLLSASQFTKFTRGVSRMDVGLEREQTQFLEDKKAFEDQQAAQEAQNKQLREWSSELNYLEAKGFIPKIDSAKNADWLGNREDPAVKARMDIFDWMDKENTLRREAGIPEIRSAYDAFRMMSAEQAENQVQQERVKEGNTRRSRGSMVGGSAPYEAGNAPKNSIIGEGGSLRDLVSEASMGM